MTQITFTTTTGQLVTTGTLGQSILEVEGYYYFSPDRVNLEGFIKAESAYTCPIKQSSCDYYYTVGGDGQKLGREVAWIYPSVNNSLFKKIEGWVGFYPRSSEGLVMESV